jgi:hypothetical protein
MRLFEHQEKQKKRKGKRNAKAVHMAKGARLATLHGLQGWGTHDG